MVFPRSMGGLFTYMDILYRYSLSTTSRVSTNRVLDCLILGFLVFSFQTQASSRARQARGVTFVRFCWRRFAFSKLFGHGMVLF